MLLDSVIPALKAVQGSLVAATAIGADGESPTARALSNAGCAIFSDYQQMLSTFRGRIDLCIIPTSIHWHARMSVDAMGAGAHVLVEKPLAGSVADALKVTEASSRTGRFAAVGFQDMYSTTTYEIKKFLCSNRLGRVRSIFVSGSWPREKPYYDRNDWAGKSFKDGWAVQDSPINNAFAHFLNLALFFSGSGIEKFARIEHYGGKLLRCYPIETFDTAKVKLQTTEGVQIDCTFTHSDEDLVDPVLTITLDQGSLVWDFENIARAAHKDGTEVARWKLDTSSEARLAMMTNVLHCLESGDDPMFPARTALIHTRVVERIMSSLPIENFNSESPSWRLRSGLLSSLLYA
ncbi:predicted dehydrogenase [Terrimicrobium sacchariphilum]|uniref:Predicted dehydrogenase n=2 Tax=Terrimicrobium sacchariphilum TaxID=690879 RepID=A0A146G2X1_TERSA|nr:predicted dehydrogenase [Terrimicrobium sacchariphilum]